MSIQRVFPFVTVLGMGSAIGCRSETPIQPPVPVTVTIDNGGGVPPVLNLESKTPSPPVLTACDRPFFQNPSSCRSPLEKYLRALEALDGDGDGFDQSERIAVQTASQGLFSAPDRILGERAFWAFNLREDDRVSHDFFRRLSREHCGENELWAFGLRSSYMDPANVHIATTSVWNSDNLSPDLIALQLFIKEKKDETYRSLTVHKQDHRFFPIMPGVRESHLIGLVGGVIEFLLPAEIGDFTLCFSMRYREEEAPPQYLTFRRNERALGNYLWETDGVVFSRAP